jgi:hypothetical protein
LSRVARKGADRGPARRGGDGRSPRKPAGPAVSTRGLPAKARLPPQLKPNNGPENRTARFKKKPWAGSLFLNVAALPVFQELFDPAFRDGREPRKTATAPEPK